MKVIAIRKDKTAIKIGENNDTAQWYKVKNAHIKFISSLKPGTPVESIKFEDLPEGNDKLLTYINLAKKDTPSTDSTAPSTSGNTASNTSLTDESKLIAMQTAVKATAETVKALTGQVTPDNINDVIEKIYDKYVNKLGL